MTILTPNQIASYWLSQDGDPGAEAIATAVALAESGGNTDITGGDGEIGLWQILPSNLTALGIPVASGYQPAVNAYAAVQLSSNGTNWGPWCTCWADPANDCATGPLSRPQPGSAAAGELALIGNQVLGNEPVTPPVPSSPPPATIPSSGGGDVPSAWSSMSDYINYGQPDIAGFFDQLGQFVAGAF